VRIRSQMSLTDHEAIGQGVSAPPGIVRAQVRLADGLGQGVPDLAQIALGPATAGPAPGDTSRNHTPAA
jgi:hypothetical protein